MWLRRIASRRSTSMAAVGLLARLDRPVGDRATGVAGAGPGSA